MPTCIHSLRAPELPMVVSAQHRFRPALLFCTALLPHLTRQGDGSAEGTDKACAILAAVWLCFSWSQLHVWLLAATVRLQEQSTQQCMAARVVSWGPFDCCGALTPSWCWGQCFIPHWLSSEQKQEQAALCPAAESTLSLGLLCCTSGS